MGSSPVFSDVFLPSLLPLFLAVPDDVAPARAAALTLPSSPPHSLYLPGDSPPPRPPRNPRRPSSPRLASPPLPVVEDDNSSTGGVKTSKSSVFEFLKPVDEPPRQNAAALEDDEDDWTLFAPKISPVTQQITPLRDEPTTQEGTSTYTSPRRHTDIFPRNAFEKPRDPDEVAPNASYENHAVSKQRPSNPVAEQLDRHIDKTQHPLVRTRRQQTRIRTSQNQNRHEHTEQPFRAAQERSQNQARTALQERIQDWLARIVYEPPPRLDSQPAPSTCDPAADERTEHVLRDYGYEYKDARRED
ncbi:hypothetical protein EDB85DRAFT_1902862 [Lactarius pseudohatsudake]|nr:hypothetical protein EDB85DRAFT_1902862 [Lactarius pseudohatsudake]